MLVPTLTLISFVDPIPTPVPIIANLSPIVPSGNIVVVIPEYPGEQSNSNPTNLTSSTFGSLNLILCASTVLIDKIPVLLL